MNTNNCSRLGRHTLAIGLLVGTIVPISYAQIAPDAGSVFRDLRNNSTIQLPTQTQAAPISTPKKEIVPLGTEEDLRVTVSTIQLVGELPPNVSADEIYKILSAPKSVTKLSELVTLANQVEEYIKSKDYPLVKVILPNQEIFNGRVRLLLINGKIDNLVKIIGTNQRIEDEVLEEYFNTLIRDGRGFKRLDYERQMLLLNDLPGISAHLILHPGQNQGIVNADLEVKEGPKYSGFSKIDNFGSTSTGQNRLTVGGYWNDVSNVGDLLGVTLIASDKNLYAGRVDYTRPIGPNGWIANVSAMVSNYQIAGNLASFGVKGSSQSYDAGLSYPLILHYRENLYASISVGYRRFETDTDGLDPELRNIAVVRAGLRGSRNDYEWLGGTTFGNVYLYSGTVMPQSGMSYSNNRNYDKVTFLLGREQNLGNGFSLNATWSGQRTRYEDNSGYGYALDSSEQMVLGGFMGVRAYSSDALYANNGDLFRLELRKNLMNFSEWCTLQAIAFYDNGIAHFDPINQGRNQIQGAGIGLSLIQYGKYQVVGGYAKHIGTSTYNNLLDDAGTGRFWLSGIVQF